MQSGVGDRETECARRARRAASFPKIRRAARTRSIARWPHRHSQLRPWRRRLHSWADAEVRLDVGRGQGGKERRCLEWQYIVVEVIPRGEGGAVDRARGEKNPLDSETIKDVACVNGDEPALVDADRAPHY